MTNYYILPGLGNSGEEHWQSHLEKKGSNFTRINQDNWNDVQADVWLERVSQILMDKDLSSTVLVGHSLACLCIVKWALKTSLKLKGAVLVAPADMENPPEIYPIQGFTPIELELIPFKTVLIASTNDPWIHIDRARFFAEKWGSDFINIGNAGHISASSGYGEWPFIEKLLLAYFD